MQTRFGSGGNCLQACLASILEIALDEAYDAQNQEREGKDWYRELIRWGYRRGYLIISYHQMSGMFPKVKPRGYHIAGGPSLRDVPEGHAVVCFDGEMVHDPHPDGTGISEIEAWTILIPTVDPDVE